MVHQPPARRPLACGTLLPPAFHYPIGFDHKSQARAVHAFEQPLIFTLNLVVRNECLQGFRRGRTNKGRQVQRCGLGFRNQTFDIVLAFCLFSRYWLAFVARVFNKNSTPAEWKTSCRRWLWFYLFRWLYVRDFRCCMPLRSGIKLQFGSLPRDYNYVILTDNEMMTWVTL